MQGKDSGGEVESRNLGTDCAQDFVGNRIGPLGNLGGRNFVISLAPDEYRLITHGGTRDLGDIHHDHVHAD